MSKFAQLVSAIEAKSQASEGTKAFNEVFVATCGQDLFDEYQATLPKPAEAEKKSGWGRKALIVAAVVVGSAGLGTAAAIAWKAYNGGTADSGTTEGLLKLLGK